VADGFFEWQKMGDTKIPQYITRRDHGPFCFAGLWDRWSRGEDALESATIITTTANELMSQFHDRMPVILQPRDYQRWLLGDAQDSDGHGLLELLKPDSPDAWQVRPVATRVNSVRNDDEACIAPVAP
jgi:putative SOS response-associated peptidase YedK